MRNHIASCFASRYPSLVGIVDDLLTLFLKKKKKKKNCPEFLKCYLLQTLTSVVKLDSMEVLCYGLDCMYDIVNEHWSMP